MNIFKKESGFTRTPKFGVPPKGGGFTLIELLVVIAIIGVLSTVVFASLNDSRSKSRNARRNSDVKQLLNAFGLGLANSSPPYTLPASTGWYCVSLDCYDQWNIYDEAA